MVSYRRWVAIVHDIVEAKGLALTGPGTADRNQQVVSVSAEIWNRRKSELEGASEELARRIANEEISVTLPRR